MKERKTILKVMILLAIVILAIIIFLCIRNARVTDNTANKIKVISQEQLSQYIEEIPITTENWKDYIYLENIKEERKNDFGEITSTNIITVLKLKDNSMYGHVALKIKVNKDLLYPMYVDKNEQVITIEEDNTLMLITGMKDKNKDENITDYTITENEFNCIQTKGSLYKINIPEDIWQVEQRESTKVVAGEVTQRKGKRYFNVGQEDSYITYWEDTYIEDLANKFKQEYIIDK